MSKVPADVASHRDFNRLLLLFAPEKTHPGHLAAREQLAELTAQLQQWELRVFSIFSSGAVFLDGERLERVEAADYRRDFGARREEFTAVLLDMDGSEVMRQHGRPQLQEMIDAIRSRQAPAPATKQGRPAPHAQR